MADWVHRTTSQLLISVSPASLPEPQANYIEDPDLTAVKGFDSRYWVITGDVITLMSQAERDALDAAEKSKQLDDLADLVEVPETLTMGMSDVLLDEINVLRALHALPAISLRQFRDAIRSKL